jgi:hypothetical protein
MSRCWRRYARTADRDAIRRDVVHLVERAARGELVEPDKE